MIGLGLYLGAYGAGAVGGAGSGDIIPFWYDIDAFLTSLLSP